jgi:hypothetical protein
VADFDMSELEREQLRAAQLADECQLLRLLRDLAQDAADEAVQRAAYTGQRLPTAMVRLVEGLRVLKEKQ